MKPLNEADLTYFMSRIISHLAGEQRLTDRMVLAVGHAWKGLLTDEDFREIVLEKGKREDELELLAAEFSNRVLERMVEK